MGYFEYIGSRKVSAEIDQLTVGDAFYTLLMAAMRWADTDNLDKLQKMFPEVWNELCQRYNAPGGKLEGEP